MIGNANRKITKRVVDELQPGQTIWDMETAGFAVRCQKRSKTYCLKVRIRGKQRWITIGKHGAPWTPEQARKQAKVLLGDIASGGDPVAERQLEKDLQTVESVAEKFLAEHVATKCKPRTAVVYWDLVHRVILPKIGSHDIKQITRADIAKLHHDLSKTPRQANHALSVISKMFNWAEQRGLRPDNSNPCRHVERYRLQPRERFLSEQEMVRLAEALLEMENTMDPFPIAAIRMLCFTGARLSEILEAKWEWVDFERALLALPDSKTGKKVIYLSAPALEVLAQLPRYNDNPYIIVGRKKGTHLINLQKPWREIRSRAGLDDVRIHDLRHSFASFAVGSGHSLPVIGRLLGHSNTATTQKYAHLGANPIRDANEAIGQRIAATMGINQEANITEIRKSNG